MGAPSEKPNGRNLGILAGASPKYNYVKGWIRNLALYEGGTDFIDTLNLMFRPAQVGEQGAASYEKMRVMGMSHQYQSYSHTENAIYSFQIYENALMILKTLSSPERGSREGSASSLKAIADILERDRRFIQALTLPYESPFAGISTSPAPLIVSIPGIITMRCKLVNYNFDYRKCDIDGNLKEWSCQVTFEEAPMSRITMLDQMTVGSFREW